VLEMRLRMRRELAQSDPARFDIKQDPGGIADIEFLVQYWVLGAAPEHPQLVDHSDNIRQLEGLALTGIVETETASWLKETYINYRTILHHLSLEGGERVVEAGPHAGTRAKVREIWRRAFETAADN
jgi:[glutamine synthetase] adenylyltransferase / [glutamine synthetase]-adenylyl-L-tyrosine phosphorylase